MIEAKRQGQEIAEAQHPKLAPVIDLMEALKKSIAEKKPTTAAERSRPSAPSQPKRKPPPPKRSARNLPSGLTAPIALGIRANVSFPLHQNPPHGISSAGRPRSLFGFELERSEDSAQQP